MPLDRALAETAAARARLERVYGSVPAVVMFTQREPNGPVRIGRALRLAGGVKALHAGDERPVIVSAVVPGGKALEAWWHRGHAARRAGDQEYSDAGVVVGGARWFGAVHARAYGETGDMVAAGITALRDLDPFLRDFERLYRNGASYQDLADFSGQTLRQVQATLDRMRALAFDMPHRRVYGRRARA